MEGTALICVPRQTEALSPVSLSLRVAHWRARVLTDVSCTVAAQSGEDTATTDDDKDIEATDSESVSDQSRTPRRRIPPSAPLALVLVLCVLFSTRSLVPE